MSTVRNISKNRASQDGNRFVTAFGRLFSVPAQGRIDPNLNVIYAPFSSDLFSVSAGETCAQALERHHIESARIAEINHY